MSARRWSERGLPGLAWGALCAASLAGACQPTESDPGARASECATCHLPDYLHARDPVHVDVKPTTCGVCHSQDDWRPSVMHHEWWPLTGAHTKAECSYCHKGTPTLYKGTSTACVGCHREDYETSKFPGHARFPTTCADCHTTAAWKPATKHTAGSAEADAGAATPSTSAPKPATTTKPTPRPVPTPPRPTPAPTPRPPATPAPTASSWPAPDTTTHASPRRH